MFKSIEKLKWKYILSEILLIVIAINIGLWFNNLNDNSRARSLETKILNEFLVSLNSDKEDIFSNIETHKKGIESCMKLVKNETENLDTIKRNLGRSYSWTYLIADLSSYESLKSIGFQLIKNDEIRHGITKLYNVDYRTITEAENNHKRICNLFDEKISDIYIVENNRIIFKKPNDTTLNSLKISLLNLQNSHSTMQRIYEIEVLSKVEDLISNIHKELN